jgi:hypothetical protein
MLLAPAAILRKLDAGLELLVLGGIVADALAFGTFHLDQIILRHRESGY